jgi:hypothetical protein
MYYKMGPVPINYGDSPLFTALRKDAIAPGGDLGAAATNENFWRTAFSSTAVGTSSAPFVIDALLREVSVLRVISETTETGEAESSAREAFTGSFIKDATQGSLQSIILASDKFKDNFNARYAEIFPPQPGNP